MPSATKYLFLHHTCALKRLENLSIYNRATDELYEVNEETVAFLKRCLAGVAAGDLRPAAVEFVEKALAQDILQWRDRPRPGPPEAGIPPPRPSLRYLELQLTGACNLHCRPRTVPSVAKTYTNGPGGSHELGTGIYPPGFARGLLQGHTGYFIATEAYGNPEATRYG